MCGVEKHLQDTLVLFIADKAPHTFYQWLDVANGEYIKIFNSCVIVLDTLGGPLPIHPKLVDAKLVLLGYKDPDNLKQIMSEKAILSAWKEYFALLALSGANRTQFGGLKDKLENKSLLGHDNYPEDQAELLHIMNKYKPEVATIQRIHQKNTDGMAFIQAGEAGKQADKPNNNKNISGGNGDFKMNSKG